MTVVKRRGLWSCGPSFFGELTAGWTRRPLSTSAGGLRHCLEVDGGQSIGWRSASLEEAGRLGPSPPLGQAVAALVTPVDQFARGGQLGECLVHRRGPFLKGVE